MPEPGKHIAIHAHGYYLSGQPVPQLSAFDTLIPQLMSKWSIPGATLAITKDGRLVFARGYGYANTATMDPVQPDSLFRIASISQAVHRGCHSQADRTREAATQHLLEHKGGWDDTIAGVPDPPFAYADTAGSVWRTILAGQTSRDFIVPNSACGIPSTAQAYSFNVTVVPNGPLGYLTVWPSGQTQPLVSTLNSLDGRVKANAAIVPAGNGGAVTVFASNDTHLVLEYRWLFRSCN